MVMISVNRKRRRSCDGEEESQVLPQAKRSGGYSFLPEVGRDVWDSEVGYVEQDNSLTLQVHSYTYKTYRSSIPFFIFFVYSLYTVLFMHIFYIFIE